MLRSKLKDFKKDIHKLVDLSEDKHYLETEVLRLKGIIKFFETNYKNQFESYQNTLEDMTIENNFIMSEKSTIFPDF